MSLLTWASPLFPVYDSRDSASVSSEGIIALGSITDESPELGAEPGELLLWNGDFHPSLRTNQMMKCNIA